MSYTRLKNRTIAKVITAFPSLSKRLVANFHPWESEDIPWTPVIKPLEESSVAIVTTAGVHHRDQAPFDMNDPDGDPSSRTVEASRPPSTLMITHDYYDHKDADRDLNIVLPLDRLREMEAEGVIGRLQERHYSFMGHIDGRHVPTLVEKSGPDVARRLQEEGADIVLLTPG